MQFLEYADCSISVVTNQWIKFLKLLQCYIKLKTLARFFIEYKLIGRQSTESFNKRRGKCWINMLVMDIEFLQRVHFALYKPCKSPQEKNMKYHEIG